MWIDTAHVMPGGRRWARALAVMAVALLTAGSAAAQVGRAGGAPCDRDCLIGVAEQYIDAPVAKDPTRLPLASAAVRYTENGQRQAWQIAELFKVEKGLLHEIEAILERVPYGMGSGWSSWEDAMSDKIQWQGK